MGQDVDDRDFSREDRTRHRAKVRRCLDVFARMLTECDFTVDEPLVGIEIEFNLVDELGHPVMSNVETLAAIADDDFQTELGLYNVEINVPPGSMRGRGLADLEDAIRDDLNAAEERAQTVGSGLMMVGILPTVREEHFQREVISAEPRYHLLSEQILTARGEDIEIAIDGVDRLRATADTIIPEAACTSTQLHLQVEPETFAATWNAAQAIAAVQVAVGANSPFLLGQQLWHETRIPLFEQATDTRSEELKAQGVRPRVFFGERWITSVFDLFEENVKFFPALLPIVDDEEDPLEALTQGLVPKLSELRLHNGTVYRWNRPIYDDAGGRPHLRIENRLLPAGPSVVDTLANAALFYGLVTTLAAQERPVWSQLPFRTAQENFHRAARAGIDSRLDWPGVGRVRVRDLVLHHLLPQAADGLATLSVDPGVSDRLLGIIEQRCVTGRNGATWQVAEFTARGGVGRRDEALPELVRAYRGFMHRGDPVHTWPVGHDL